DARGAHRDRRRRPDRRGGRGHEGRPGGQAGGWRPGPRPGAAHSGARPEALMDATLGQIAFLVLLTLLEAFFVASEIALVSVRRSRIDQLVDEGSPAARRVRR